MSSVVVLNATFEPLGVVSVRRALTHLARNRVVVIDSAPGTVRSANAEYPVPRVVQFKTHIRVPHQYQEQIFTRRAVLIRDKFQCAYCLAYGNTVDHIIPRSRGGKDAWLNCVAACGRCNSKKRDRTPEEAGMPLLFEPRTVNTRDTLLRQIAATGADLATLGLDS